MILTIIAIAVAAVVAGFVLHTLFHRFGRPSPRAMQRRPDREGHAGRTSEFRDG